ncbi:hypothetical protein CTAYLR_002459 [Chrysophaeum taylorii]|uniref:YHS domain-containing protein n=1 Tax=Chrysophaeum taylorii TaxID=2483200 RepID=A0AAD7UP54_9STRA|nr:hypothetical protein CTAYLR_002459 [Chrysophaeum taylorii]
MPVDVCAQDTTTDEGSMRAHCCEASLSARSPLLGRERCAYGVDSGEPRVLGGSVPATRLAGIVASSLAVVAIVAFAAGSHAKSRMMSVPTLDAVAFAHPRRSQLVPVEVDESTAGPALLGVDVVAYRFLNAGDSPVFGSSDYAYTLSSTDVDGSRAFETTFWFSSAANRDLFASDPTFYAPRFGGFCAYGITSEYAAGWDASMDAADATEGWPWARDHLGPPADLRTWTIRDDKLYFTFLPAVMEVFLENYDDLAPTGEKRWAEWFGDSGVAGPFNIQCMAKSYGPPTVRTCTYEAQDTYPQLIPRRQAVADPCDKALLAACADDQGNDPVQDNACSTCLDDHYSDLKDACPTTDGALQAHVDKVFCW